MVWWYSLVASLDTMILSDEIFDSLHHCCHVWLSLWQVFWLDRIIIFFCPWSNLIMSSWRQSTCMAQNIFICVWLWNHKLEDYCSITDTCSHLLGDLSTIFPSGFLQTLQMLLMFLLPNGKSHSRLLSLCFTINLQVAASRRPILWNNKSQASWLGLSLHETNSCWWKQCQLRYGYSSIVWMTAYH